MWKLIRAAIPVQLLEMEMQRGRCEGSAAQRAALGAAPGGGAGSPLTPGSARGEQQPSPELGRRLAAKIGLFFPPSPFFLFTF